MESKHAHNRTYEDFDPLFKWRREQGSDTIELHLPGMLLICMCPSYKFFVFLFQIHKSGLSILIFTYTYILFQKFGHCTFLNCTFGFQNREFFHE
jgi:hypothetical protein